MKPIIKAFIVSIMSLTTTVVTGIWNGLPWHYITRPVVPVCTGRICPLFMPPSGKILYHMTTFALDFLFWFVVFGAVVFGGMYLLDRKRVK